MLLPGNNDSPGIMWKLDCRTHDESLAVPAIAKVLLNVFTLPASPCMLELSEQTLHSKEQSSTYLHDHSCVHLFYPRGKLL